MQINRQNPVTMKTKTVVGTTAAAINGPVKWLSLPLFGGPDMTVAVGVTVGSPAGTMAGYCREQKLVSISQHIQLSAKSKTTYLCSQSW